MKIEKYAEENYRNVVKPGKPGYWMCGGIDDMTFSRPNKATGYGAVLGAIKALTTDKCFIEWTTHRTDVLDFIRKPTRHGYYSSVFARLRLARLIKSSKSGYVLTDLGKRYVKKFNLTPAY